MCPLGVDTAHQLTHSFMTLLSDISEATPKIIFDADTGLVTSNHHRAFGNQRFHGLSPTAGNIRRLGGIIVTANSTMIAKFHAEPFELLMKSLLLGVIRCGNLLVPASPSERGSIGSGVRFGFSPSQRGRRSLLPKGKLLILMHQRHKMTILTISRIQAAVSTA
jgi:hypothetical protein